MNSEAETILNGAIASSLVYDPEKIRESFFDRSMLYLDRGWKEPAVNDFNVVMQVTPSLSSEMHISKGLLACYEDADWNSLLDKQPQKTISKMQESAQICIQECTLALSSRNCSNESIIDAYVTRGAAHLWGGNIRESVRDCSRALKIDPNNTLALNLRATCLVEARRFARAASDLERLIELEPSVESHALYLNLVRELERLSESYESSTSSTSSVAVGGAEVLNK
jgi:tetratricopeptide (TPR) repeat protein